MICRRALVISKNLPREGSQCLCVCVCFCICACERVSLCLVFFLLSFCSFSTLFFFALYFILCSEQRMKSRNLKDTKTEQESLSSTKLFSVCLCVRGGRGG